jgi:glycosyltransferase involved in cell wall biosynthesis
VELAPIAIFCYNRPDHLARAINSLRNCAEIQASQIYLFQDGPKQNTGQIDQQNLAVSRYINSLELGRELTIIKSPLNKGLAKSITDGITYVLDQHDAVIVMEDDLEVSKGFLRYMNNALRFYKNEQSVMHISGYMFPIKQSLPETLFYNTASCWGWATWKNAWSSYNSDCTTLYTELTQDAHLKYKFNINGSADFFNQLHQNVNGTMDTWAVKWYAAIFNQGGLSLHPGKSLVRNIGMDGSGVHCGAEDGFGKKIIDHVDVLNIPLEEFPHIRNYMEEFYKSRFVERNWAKRLSDSVRLRIGQLFS